MSYARFGESSDVYVYAHVGGFVECCGCWLNPPQEEGWFGESEQLRSPTEVVAHMQAHVTAGHTVPDYLLDEALYPPGDFVAMCMSFMCRKDEGHDGDHSPHRWGDRFPHSSPASNEYRCPCGEPKTSPVHAGG